MGMVEMKTVTIACKVPNGLNIAGRIVTGAAQVNGNTFGGYALTPDFPADVWNAWYKDNEHSHMFENNVVFAADDHLVRARIRHMIGSRRHGVYQG